jgi:ferredoxin
MKQLTISPLNDAIEVKTETRMLDALLARELKVPMLCGGKGLCSTCHVWVEEGMSNLTPMTRQERLTLGMISGANDRSRLSCQCRIVGEPVRILVPNVQYVEKSTDLLSLVGKRTERPILHPIDGRILVEKGKIITRTRILELEKVDHDVSALRSEAGI